ncbi:MAG: glycogen/starch synthase [Bacteroidaceae bacterium]|nr:glycogen/starch synthase [Bacteroidaceae bacterium]
MTPYVEESELSQLGTNVARALQEEAGCEVRTFMPKWGHVNERRGQLHEVIRLSRIMIIIDETDHPLIIKVASIPQTRIQVYFIDNDDFFANRKMAYDPEGKEYEDNAERAVFFARGVLETVKKLRWTPDIIHCQGWMSALVPMYIKRSFSEDPAFKEAKVVTSLFKNELQNGIVPEFKKTIEFKGVRQSVLKPYSKEFNFVELEKLAMDYSDAIVVAGKDVDEVLLEHAKQTGKPMLDQPVDEANIADAYMKFYESL